MDIITAPDRPDPAYSNAFAEQAKSDFPEETKLAMQHSADGSDNSSSSFTLSTVHSGAPLELTVR